MEYKCPSSRVKSDSFPQFFRFPLCEHCFSSLPELLTRALQGKVTQLVLRWLSHSTGSSKSSSSLFQNKTVYQSACSIDSLRRKYLHSIAWILFFFAFTRLPAGKRQANVGLFCVHTGAENITSSWLAWVFFFFSPSFFLFFFLPQKQKLSGTF